MIYLLLIIVIIVLSISNSNLSSRIVDLERKLREQEKDLDNYNYNYNYCPKCGFDLKGKNEKKYNTNYQQPYISVQNNLQATNKIGEKPVIPEKPKIEMSEKEIKNSTILTVGAILVIVSAIVFLTSTWNTSLDIVKTLIIFFMFLVFLGSSVIADKYLHIKQTAKVFLYIALSYLPLVFISISLFHLLGDYLSITGAGKYIYLFISSLILAIVYYSISRKKSDVFTAIGSILFQLFSVIFLSLIISDNKIIIFVFLDVYNLFFHTLYDNKKYYFNENIHKTVKSTITVVIAISSLFLSNGYNSENIFNWLLILYLIIMYFNHYYLLEHDKDMKPVFAYTGPIHILITSLLTAFVLNGEFIIYQMLLIIGILIIYYIDYVKDNVISISNFIITSIFYLIIYIASFFNQSIIPSYLLILLYGFFLIFNVQFINKYKQQLIKMIPIPFFIFIVNAVFTLELNTLLIPVMACLIFIISNLLEKTNEKITSFQKTSMIFSIIGFLLNLSSKTIIIVLLSATYAIVYYSLSMFKKKNNYKLVSYAFVITFALYFSIYIRETIYLFGYILPVSSLIIFLLNGLNPNSNSKTFLKVVIILGFINLLIPNNEILSIICYIVLTITFLLFLKENKENYNYLYIPFASYSIYYLCNTYLINNLDVLFVISLAIIGLLLLLVIVSKNNRYIIMSFILSMISIFTRIIDKYYALILLIMCFVIYYIYCNKRNQDLYKAGLFILVTILLRFIIGDLGLEYFTVLRIGIYVISFILISRSIIKKHFENYKILEYVFLSLLYFVAIGLYEVESNGMLFVLLLLILTIVGYYKKWGPVFLT